ncbi:hypothetical protein BGLT_02232 [Caballeronia glathei]|uniref:Uncharacterized protein n=1 Tax=Caballeronia glathei TaxID=60547 RepID=A0A069PLN6_9BURK|nr:hypothetical protein [Caballeronia glathei]KDR41598.1 hypothetical protein BG61_16885 [Caballeronia glathei]CDY79451.1 hypothetical protein BGLT_02232 [Caballeronia glathei]
MKSSAELVVKLGQLHTKIEEASAKGFKTDAAMKLLYELESVVDSLLAVGTAEFVAREVTQ